MFPIATRLMEGEYLPPSTIEKVGRGHRDVNIGCLAKPAEELVRCDREAELCGAYDGNFVRVYAELLCDTPPKLEVSFGIQRIAFSPR